MPLCTFPKVQTSCERLENCTASCTPASDTCGGRIVGGNADHRAVATLGLPVTGTDGPHACSGRVHNCCCTLQRLVTAGRSSCVPFRGRCVSSSSVEACPKFPCVSWPRSVYANAPSAPVLASRA